MATPKVLLKRSSIVGRVPDSSDLQYGELAINFADGKLYYKDDSNNIKAFIDSARVQAIADAVEIVAQSQLDSGETTTLVTGLVDSNYVQSRTNETYLATIIDSAYVQARQADIFRDSDYITNTITQNLSLGEFILGLDPGVDVVQNPSDFTATLASQIAAGTGITLSGGTGWNDALTINADGVDSATVEAIVDSAYVQSRQIRGADSAWVTSQIPTFGTDYIDSATASAIITADVTKSFVDALGTNADTLDGFHGAHYLEWGNFTSVPRILDSAMVYRFTIDSARTIALIDSAHVQPLARKGLSGGVGVTYDNTSGEISIDSNSTVTVNRVVADSGDITKLKFETTTFTDVDVPDNLPPFQEGNLFYFQGPDALTYSNSDINVKIAQDEIVRVYNNTGSDIAKGKVVYVTGAANDFPTIALAKADNYNTVYTTIGLTSHTIPNGTFGFVTVRGLYGGLNTAEFNAGDIVHVSFDSAGELTNTQPQFPNYPFEIGTVLVADSASGGNVGGCIQVNPKAEIFEGIRVDGNSRFDADVTIAGNLNILGSETITQVQNLQVTDNFIYIGAGDTVTTLFDGTGTNDGLIKDYYEGDSSKYYFVYIYDADSALGGDLIRLHTGDSAGAFDNGTSTQINFDSAGGSTTLDLSDDRTLLPLRNNIKITFETAGGHDSGDYWYGLAAPVNQDLGIVGNYNLPDAPYSHAGFFRDASDQKFKIFNKYDPEVSGNINTTDPSFELGTMVANTFEGDLAGDVTGTVSDISNHTTTELAEGSNLYYTTSRHDSDTLAQVNAAYVQARQTTYNTSDFTDSAYVTGLPVSTFTNDANYLDSTTVTGVVDQTYINNLVAADYLDSAEAIALIDTAHVQARQITYNTSNFTDSAYVTGLPVSTFTNDANYLDSTTVQGVIDATYIQANQTTYNTSDFTDSAFVTGLPVSTFTNNSGYLTTATTTSLVDSAYIQARRPEEAIFSVVNDGASAYKFTGDGFDSANNPTLYLQRGLTYKFNVNASGHPFEIRLSNGGAAYDTGVTNNANQDSAVYFTPHMDAPNTLVYQCTVHSGMVGDIVIVDNNSFLDSSSVTGVIDAAYIQSNQITYNTSNFTDSATVIRLITENAIDSGIALQLLLDSSEVVNLIDSAYIQARQTVGGGGTVDSATTIALIEATVDSAYVQARQTAGGGGTGTVDSDYVLEVAGGSVTGLYQQTFYRFQADSGQTVFTGTDEYGQTLNYGAGAVDVFLNGILLLDSADYTQTSSSALTLIEPADSADEIHIIYRRGTLVTPNVTTYEYTATGGQTTFTGTDLNGKTLTYAAGAVQIFVNGILLKSTVDYTATDGSSIVLATAASLNDDVAIAAYAAPHAKATSFNFTADSAQATFNGADNFGNSLNYEPENSLVFLNGIALSDSDFTATNGTSVVLATAANLNDELKVVSFGAVTTTQTNNNWTETSTSIKISPNEKKFVDVSSAAVLLEIQDSGSNVSMGDELRIIDGYGNAATNNITLRSTKKIIGSDSDFIIDINRSGTNFVYYNESNGWVLIEN